MGRAIIDAGVCGLRSEVRVVSRDGIQVQISIVSQCSHVTRLAEELDGKTWDGLVEVTRPRGDGAEPTPVQARFYRCIPHPGCPVYSGIVKAIEVTLGMALPAESRIQIVNDS